MSKRIKTGDVILDDYMNKRFEDPRLGEIEDGLAVSRRKTLYAGKANVLCVPSPYHPCYKNKQDLGKLRVSNVMHIEDRFAYGNLFTHVARSLMSEDTSIVTLANKISGDFLVHSKPREEVEHNPHYWQLVVCGVLKLKDGAIMLRNNHRHPRLPDMLTLVQGHVDANKDMHFMTSNDFLTMEFVRELLEELRDKRFPRGIPFMDENELFRHTKIQGAIQINRDPVGMDHLGIFCVTDLSKFDDISMRDFESNEMGHDVRTLESAKTFLDSIEKHPMKMDSWVGPLFDMAVYHKLF